MLSPTRTAVLLHEYLALYGAGPFDWRRRNCCLFAAGWVRHATGAWPMHGLPDTPTRRAAKRLVRRLGGNLVAAWTEQMECPALPAVLARLGDVVLMPVPACHTGIGEAVGVCNGAHAVIIDAQGRLDHVPMATCTHAWRLWPAADASTKEPTP